jgi:hypothetical protein
MATCLHIHIYIHYTYIDIYDPTHERSRGITVNEKSR